jgi:hypothetical protein
MENEVLTQQYEDALYIILKEAVFMSKLSEQKINKKYERDFVFYRNSIKYAY